ncbi:MAG TPA: preprotein translocase subunit SecG [Steroidobacteraceae bacterium]|jgi:preprotein translocase subunit SecG|nr:preprotein translocase subunit SecG [Steroidobacteraceae bacterium]
MLRGFILSVHILLALMIIGLVLMQRGKGAEAGAGFGSGASGTVFGARGTATLFSKLTAVFAALFFVTSLTLAYMGTRSPAEATSVLERAAQAAAAARAAAPPASTGPAGSTAPASTAPAPQGSAPASSAPAPATTPPAEPPPPTNKP